MYIHICLLDRALDVVFAWRLRVEDVHREGSPWLGGGFRGRVRARDRARVRVRLRARVLTARRSRVEVDARDEPGLLWRVGMLMYSQRRRVNRLVRVGARVRVSGEWEGSGSGSGSQSQG